MHTAGATPCLHPASQNNKLVTLAGSLRQLKFLTKLDVSGNQLRGLDKVLGTLQHLRFLSHLNIKVRGGRGVCRGGGGRGPCTCAVCVLLAPHCDHAPVAFFPQDERSSISVQGMCRLAWRCFFSTARPLNHPRQGKPCCCCSLAAAHHCHPSPSLHNTPPQGNPCCCEEPSYRATVLAALPQLEVLDLHTVTPLERHRALQAAGGGKDAAARATVAFGCKVPSFDASLTAMVPVRSAIERELQKVRAGGRRPVVRELVRGRICASAEGVCSRAGLQSS